jgi:ATP-dependent Clp protease, protease subunit
MDEASRNHHKIVFSAEISERTVHNFILVLEELREQGAEVVTIGLNSNGGNVVAGMMLHNILKAMPYELRFHNIGNVDSIANVIFLSGSSRLACPASTFMFHGVGFDTVAQERLEEKSLLEKLDTLNADHKRIAKIIAAATGNNELFVLDLFKQQNTRGVEWAKEKGFIQEIADFTLPRIDDGHVRFFIS